MILSASLWLHLLCLAALFVQPVYLQERGAAPTGREDLGLVNFPLSAIVGQAALISYTAPDLNVVRAFPFRIKATSQCMSPLSALTYSQASATGGTYIWTPSAGLEPASDYVLELSQGGGDPNYSAQFEIMIGGSSSTVAVSTATAGPPRQTTTGASSQLIPPSRSSISSVSTTTLPSSVSASASASEPASSASTNPSNTSSPAPGPTPGGNTGASGGGLSTGEKVAIGVAVPIGVILIGAAGFFIGRRKKLSPAAEGRAEAAELDGKEWRGPELPANGGQALDGRQVGGDAPAELAARDSGRGGGGGQGVIGELP
ncbi:hypothetical protein P152DRAFT_512597 [Eremomyces bilateralis CBS 781.70]|uniref:Yeast cell wall synthesis Kre9/Knh1-like N-terminal domain-containing protein n=1 Tax=Eremomyces bilateralis CBS 781.70 TaxID=1392243 RepID=A0A6G1G7Y7_9PEZI|nr:uncharacterized protein P152DRAFT_512597 [Eremomyces bilateralis CBS 781.70]KAF1814178.1 hypothetical protein P152DRAFT_512597 [Eremomyces bilateralis CBS 781.70]